MTNRPFFALALLGCFAAATPQPKPGQNLPKQPTPAPDFVKIQPAGTGGWKSSSIKLPELAKRVGAAVKGLKNTVGYLNGQVQTPEGRGHYPALQLKVQDAARFRVDYIVIQRIPFSATLTNNGKMRMVRLDDQIRRMTANSVLPAASQVRGNALVSLFETDFSRLAFQGLTERIDAWGPVLNGMAAGAQGYKVSVEERSMTYQGQKFLSYRVLAKRSAAGKGSSTFEIVFDGKRYLPVTIRNVRKDPNGKSYMVQWTAGYQFNQKLAQKDFTLGS